jgi:hypothetical protein
MCLRASWARDPEEPRAVPGLPVRVAYDVSNTVASAATVENWWGSWLDEVKLTADLRETYGRLTADLQQT